MQPQPQFQPGGAQFKVHAKESEQPDKTADELERQIQALREEATEKRQAEQHKQALMIAQEREAKFKALDSLKENLESLNEASNLTGKLSLHDAMELSDEKRKLIQKIEAIEIELGFRVIDDPKVAVKKTFGLSSSKALWAIAGLTLLSFLLFWAMGTAAVSDDPMNDSARRMMNSVGLRVLTNFLPFSIAILAAVGFIWLLFPSVFGYWHNKVSTSFSLISDLEQCEPYQRVAFFAFSYGLPVWAFVQLMQVIFG